MPKHSNNHPWPDNLRYDFNLPPTISSSDAEVFIYTLPTTERNRAFLLLRYRDGKTYKEIAAIYDMTPAGVRLGARPTTTSFPNRFPVRSWRRLVSHPQEVALPVVSLYARTSFSCPQSQQQCQTTLPLWRLSVGWRAISFPNRMLVRSLIIYSSLFAQSTSLPRCHQFLPVNSVARVFFTVQPSYRFDGRTVTQTAKWYYYYTSITSDQAELSFTV